jgi:hypothetical protein
MRRLLPSESSIQASRYARILCMLEPESPTLHAARVGKDSRSRSVAGSKQRDLSARPERNTQTIFGTR